MSSLLNPNIIIGACMSEDCSPSKCFKYLSKWSPKQNEAQYPIDVQVVTCFLQRGKKILVLQRARKDSQYKLWGIPGGKLEQNELPLMGLIREIKEELGINVSSEAFNFLNTALSQIPSEKKYGLYLYHALLPSEAQIRINQTEHYSFRWVTINEFRSLDLLTAQREAFELVEDQLINIMELS